MSVNVQFLKLRIKLTKNIVCNIIGIDTICEYFGETKKSNI